MADITTTSTSGMPSWVQPYAQGFLNRAQTVADSPYQAFTGQRVADMAPWQQQGLQAQAQRAMSGSPVMNQANLGLTHMMQGGGQAAANAYGPVQAQSNPYGYAQAVGNQYGQVQPTANQFGYAQTVNNQYGPVQATANQYGYAQAVNNQYGPVQAQSNAYAGSNPYLQQSIDATLGDVSRNWNNIQKPQWDSAMQRSGSFGNSGIAQANQMAQSDMQRNMGNIASGMRMQDYTQQQQLGEAAANRNLQASQFNASMGDAAAARATQLNQYNAGLGESAASRALQAGQFNASMGDAAAARASQMNQFNAGLGESAALRALQAGQFNASMGDAAAARASQMNQFNAGLGESAAARAMQAGQFNATMGENYAGRQDSMFNQGQGRALSALGMAPQYAQQDYNDISQLQQAGGAYQGQNQRLLDNQYAQFLESRNYPQQQLDIMGNALGRSYGQTNTTTQPGPSTGSQLVGGALTGAGLYNLLFGGG